MKRVVRWGMRTGRQALVRAVGRGLREQVVVLDAVTMSKMWEESMREKAVREGGGRVVWEGEGDWDGGGGGVANGGSKGAVDLGDFIVKGEEERGAWPASYGVAVF